MTPLIIIDTFNFAIILVPFFFINQPIKRLVRISLLIVLILLVPPAILGNIYFDYTKKVYNWQDTLILTFALSLSTIALLPMAFKSTVLLWRHEIRLYEYNRNILLFLVVALGESFLRLVFGLSKFISIITS